MSGAAGVALTLTVAELLLIAPDGLEALCPLLGALRPSKDHTHPCRFCWPIEMSETSAALQPASEARATTLLLGGAQEHGGRPPPSRGPLPSPLPCAENYT